MESQVVVLGAGVIGLTTALQLQQKGFHVTILAHHLPGDLDKDYTSPWYGALFLNQFWWADSNQSVFFFFFFEYIHITGLEHIGEVTLTKTILDNKVYVQHI